jgi:hypothetical protein
MQGKCEVTVELRAEWDEQLLIRLNHAVARCGGTMKLTERGVAGSQDIQVYSVKLPFGHVSATAETYMGLRLSGPPALVQELVVSLKSV